MRKFIVVIILFLNTSVFAQQKYTLNDIIDIALENNYSIRISRNDLQIAHNNYSLGNAGFLPRADLLLTRDFGAEDTEQRFADGTEQNREDAKSNSFSRGGDVTWTVFDGGQMFFNYERLESLQLRSEAELQFAIETLLYEINLAFYQAALERERLALFESNLEFSEVRLRISKDRYEVGSSSKMEYLQAQVDYNADQSAILSQLEVLAARKYELLNLMGINKDSLDFVIEYDLNIPSSIEFEEVLNSIQLQNSQLQALKWDVQVASSEKKVLKGQHFPELDLYFGYNMINTEAGAGFIIQRNAKGLNYGLTARWNIFNGFNLQRQVQNAQIAIENSELEVERQKLELETNAKTTYLNFQNNLQLMQLEEQNLEVARENNEIAQERYRIGLSNPLELREAQVNYVNAELRYQNAAFAAKMAEIQLLYLSGTTVRRTTR